MPNFKTYSELITLPTFEERFEYLKLSSKVAEETFGFDRYLNQVFYRSARWKSTRNKIIIRDEGCDLGIPDRPIQGKIFIHHMNPILLEDIESNSDFLLNPEYLICAAFETHNAVHYGDENLLILVPQERTKGDTKLW